jgi:dihydropyrimidinase
MTTLITNGTVVTATDMARADVLIDGERIQAIGTGFGDADTVIDAAGRPTSGATGWDWPSTTSR